MRLMWHSMIWMLGNPSRHLFFIGGKLDNRLWKRFFGSIFSGTWVQHTSEPVSLNSFGRKLSLNWLGKYHPRTWSKEAVNLPLEALSILKVVSYGSVNCWIWFTSWVSSSLAPSNGTISVPQSVYRPWETEVSFCKNWQPNYSLSCSAHRELRRPPRGSWTLYQWSPYWKEECNDWAQVKLVGKVVCAWESWVKVGYLTELELWRISKRAGEYIPRGLCRPFHNPPSQSRSQEYNPNPPSHNQLLPETTGIPVDDSNSNTTSVHIVRSPSRSLRKASLSVSRT